MKLNLYFGAWITTVYRKMNTSYQVAIIGAGFGGIIAALRLIKSGIKDIILLERASDVGGTWRDNNYPGCACDIPSSLYCIADHPNPKWTRFFSGQAEIWSYMKNLCRTQNLYQYLQLNSAVKQIKFDEQTGNWSLTIASKDKDAYTIHSKFVISATGPLNRPSIPAISGRNLFNGPQFHSSEWQHDFDPKDKRIALVGTGASAIQIAPELARCADQLYVLQRTPAWITPRRDSTVSPWYQKLSSNITIIEKLKREIIFWINEFVGMGMIGNKTVHNLSTKAAKNHLYKQVKNLELRNKLLPNYKIGCKRILRSDDYYPIFEQPNVRLVTESIQAIDNTHITLATGEKITIDAIIWATGFIAADIELEGEIIGLKNRSLIAEWKIKGAQAYKGTIVAGFPNLFFILGPNTGLGHNSILHIMESQMDYILKQIEFAQSLPNDQYLDVKPTIEESFNKRLQAKLSNTVWASGCHSWYINKNGLNTTIYPGLNRQFRKEMNQFEPSNYELMKTRQIE